MLIIAHIVIILTRLVLFVCQGFNLLSVGHAPIILARQLGALHVPVVVSARLVQLDINLTQQLKHANLQDMAATTLTVKFASDLNHAVNANQDINLQIIHQTHQIQLEFVVH